MSPCRGNPVHMPRVLIQSCSQRKLLNAELVPAIDRYDGPAFHVLRRYLRQEQARPPEIYILSAEFGLLRADAMIPSYDRRMTAQRASELATSVSSNLFRWFDDAPWLTEPAEQLLVNLGRDYIPALAGYDGTAQAALSEQRLRASQGARLSLLRDWLYGRPPDAPIRKSVNTDLPVRICNVSISQNAAEALKIARLALIAREGNLATCRTWYVSIDGQRVPPKWLITELTGLPVSAFTTSQARAALSRLGIEVHRA